MANSARRAAASILAASLLALAGCRGQPAALASSTVPVDGDRITILGDAEGSAYGAVVLVVPFFTRQAPLARDRAIASVPGATGLVDVSVSYKLYPLILVTLTKTTVRGKAFVAR
jgi:hypothetical protein